MGYRLTGMKDVACPTVGRPREFDVEEALGAALKVFWRKGYDGASLSELTEAMGITRPSLYCAFGNKEELFRKAFDLYEREKLAFIDQALTAPTGYDVIERLMGGWLNVHTDPETPGCMGLISALSCQGLAAESVRQELANRRFDFEARLRGRLERAKAEGDLGDADPAVLTAFVLTLSQGVALQASMGASREMLRQVVLTALQVCRQGQRPVPA
jgi:AcrR family transcriptional regulator